MNSWHTKSLLLKTYLCVPSLPCSLLLFPISDCCEPISLLCCITKRKRVIEVRSSSASFVVSRLLEPVQTSLTASLFLARPCPSVRRCRVSNACQWEEKASTRGSDLTSHLYSSCIKGGEICQGLLWDQTLS